MMLNTKRVLSQWKAREFTGGAVHEMLLMRHYCIKSFMTIIYEFMNQFYSLNKQKCNDILFSCWRVRLRTTMYVTLLHKHFFLSFGKLTFVSLCDFIYPKEQKDERFLGWTGDGVDHSDVQQVTHFNEDQRKKEGYSSLHDPTAWLNPAIANVFPVTIMILNSTRVRLCALTDAFPSTLLCPLWSTKSSRLQTNKQLHNDDLEAWYIKKKEELLLLFMRNKNKHD